MVLIVRALRPTSCLHCLLRYFFGLERRVRSKHLDRYADNHACLVWRSFGFSAGCWGWNSGRPLASRAARPGHGLLLPWASDRSIDPPILGGILTDRLEWRSTQWATVVYGGIVWVLILFCLPETSIKRLRAKSLDSTAEKQETRSEYLLVLQRACQILLQPFQVIAYLRFPPVLATVYYASSTIVTYYAVNISLQSLFSAPPYSFSPTILGLTYIPGTLGSISVAILGGRWADLVMRRQAKAAGR